MLHHELYLISCYNYFLNHISALITTVLNINISKIDNIVPDVSDLAITTILNTKNKEVDHKILDISCLVKKKVMTLNYLISNI